MDTQKDAHSDAYVLDDNQRSSSKASLNKASRDSGFTRRAALRLLLGAGLGATLFPHTALAVDKSKVNAAQDALDDAQGKYDEVNSQLTALGDEFEQLAQQQASTLGEIEETSKRINDTKAHVATTQKRIDATKRDIKKREAELESKKEVLAARVASAYKAGGQNFLSVLVSSSSFEELISNVYYLDKISESDAVMIEEVKEAKKVLDEKKAGLEKDKGQLQTQQKAFEKQKADLDALNQTQKQQLDDMRAKQEAVKSTLDGLSDEVAKLMKTRDSELLAYKEAEQAEKEAQQAMSQSRPGSSAGSFIPHGGGQQAAATGSQAAVVRACHEVGSPGAGYCAMWVSLVFQRAGYSYIGGNANDMYNAYCTSSDKNDLKVGMIVAVSTYPHNLAGRIYGHVGIYIGGGMIMENIGYINTQSLDSWIAYYGDSVPPRWGWAGNIVLS